MEKEKSTTWRHEEGQGPASMNREGVSSGYSLKELGQPIHSQNADETVPKQKRQTK